MGIQNIDHKDKLVISVILNKEPYKPGESSVLDIFNHVFRQGKDIAPLGRCNWGAVTVYCWGKQYSEFRHLLRESKHSSMSEFGVHVLKCDKQSWPRLPIDATGEDLFHQRSQPSNMTKLQKENTALKRQIDTVQKAVLPVPVADALS